MPFTIRGLATLLKALVVACNAIERWGPKIRAYVPADKQQAYDDALNNILLSCEVIRLIDYLDGWPGTNPPFGE